jgi:hypothetical protein
MLDKTKEVIRKVHAYMKEVNKPVTSAIVISALKGEATMDDVYYSLGLLVSRKYAYRVKRGVYQLTTMDKPIEKIFNRKKRTFKKKKEQPLQSFEQKLEEWDKEEKKVDFVDLCQKLQNALAKAYVDIDLLEATVSEQRVIIKYLEAKNGSNPV